MDLEQRLDQLTLRVARAEIAALAADRLLKAFITLTALEDDALLQNLEVVFALACKSGHELAGPPLTVWTEIMRELGVIKKIVDDDGLLN